MGLDIILRRFTLYPMGAAMDLEVVRESETRFRSYVDALSSVIGHADRKRPLEDYCVGLMGPSERKSVEPIAAVTAPGRTAAQHQSPRSARWCCRRSSGTEQSKRGSS